jgi:NOL1/NOP2/fmu family ribosome biogenesis protein
MIPDLPIVSRIQKMVFLDPINDEEIEQYMDGRKIYHKMQCSDGWIVLAEYVDEGTPNE